MKELALITSCFSKIGSTNDDEDLEKLQKLSLRAQELHLKIEADDKNTDSLRSAMTTVLNTKATIDSEIAKKSFQCVQVKQQAEEKRKFEEEALKLQKERAEFEAQKKKLENERIMKMKEEEAMIARKKLEEKEEEERKRMKEEEEKLKQKEEEMRQQEMKRLKDMLAEAEESKKRAEAMEREYQELRRNEGGILKAVGNFVGNLAPVRAISSWFW